MPAPYQRAGLFWCAFLPNAPRRYAVMFTLIGLTQLRACAPTWLAQTQPTAPWVRPETAGGLDE